MTIICRGYETKTTKHIEPETDSDGDGGTNPKLQGRGHIEFSAKGIPHGSLHFPEQLKWAGHMYMHDTCAPEASHKTNIKKAMNRVRKLDNLTTSASMIDWELRVRTWARIINEAKKGAPSGSKKRKVKKKPRSIQVSYSLSKILRPADDVVDALRADTFSPLRAGGDNLVSPDARISYNEVTRCIDTYAIIHMRVHICVPICVYPFVYPYMCKYVCVHICVPICVYPYVCIHMCVDICVFIYV